jgi:acyl-CoA synthetase (AMP-forming)/AMP-acid ligase II
MIEISGEATLSDRQGGLSGEELRDEVLRVAGSLRGGGLPPGGRVLVVGSKSVQLAVVMLAVPAASGVVVAPYHGLTALQLRHIHDDAEPWLTIMLDSASASASRALPDGCRTVTYADLVAGGQSAEVGEPAPGDAAAIIYTSGSTGAPKGVVLSHANLRLGAESVAAFYGLSAADRVLCLLPFSFDAGLNQLLAGLLAGCDVHLRDFMLPQHTVEVCDQQQISILTGVPALWRKLADADWTPVARDSLRRWASTGGHMPPQLASRICDLFPRSKPILMYGFTEAFRATYLPWDRFPDKPTSVGTPIPHAAIALVRPDGRLCGSGEVGEIVQFGPLVSPGYWNRPDETRSKFAPLASRTRAELEDARSPFAVPADCLDRVAWSGDDGSIDDEGFIYFHSRRTELIKSQGFRVSPTEIESACQATGLVEDAVAFGVEREGEEELITVVARPLSSGLEPHDLLKALRPTIPSYQMPSTVVLRDSLPIGPNGKYDRAILREEVSAETAAI